MLLWCEQKERTQKFLLGWAGSYLKLQLALLEGSVLGECLAAAGISQDTRWRNER